MRARRAGRARRIRVPCLCGGVGSARVGAPGGVPARELSISFFRFFSFPAHTADSFAPPAAATGSACARAARAEPGGIRVPCLCGGVGSARVGAPGRPACQLESFQTFFFDVSAHTADSFAPTPPPRDRHVRAPRGQSPAHTRTLSVRRRGLRTRGRAGAVGVAARELSVQLVRAVSGVSTPFLGGGRVLSSKTFLTQSQVVLEPSQP